MRPERWRQITAIFHAARSRDVTTRASFLDSACAGDSSLRAEIEEMLAADRDVGRFGETPLFTIPEKTPRLESGATLGPYRIEDRIGAGGMGEVYRAHDPRLDRAVAIKVLYSAPLGDPGARLHLMREARSAAALNHPHICTIHEVGEADGQAYIAMEFIEGQPLDELIPAGGLPVDDVLRYGVQIADAMAHAHSRGILHRDLKPANVIVSELGIPKILDFGLARVLPIGGRTDTGFGTSQTTSALLLGTPAYMSPEQARGHPTDERSDIFSCGVMLYELAAGRPPFAGATPTEILDNVIHAGPDRLARVRRDISSALSTIVHKALAKDPAHRYQRMSELAADLRRLQRRISAGTKSALAASMVGTVVLVAGITVWLVRPFREETGGLLPARIVQMTTLPGLEYSPTWSPDGRFLAYISDAAGNLDIYVQQIVSGKAVRLTDSDADDAQPAWSPDGSRIAFVSARAHQEKNLSVLIGMRRLQSVLGLRNGDIWLMPARGGTPRLFAQDAYDPAWSPDGKKIVYVAPKNGQWGLWIREVDRPGEALRLAVAGMTMTPPRFESAPVLQPAWSPDGKWIAFTAGPEDPYLRIFVVPSEGGQAAAVTVEDANTQMPSWSRDGRWLYFSSERNGRINLYRAAFRDGGVGPVQQVTAGTGADLQARVDPQGTRIAYSSVRDVLDLWQYDLKSANTIRLTSETTDEDNVRPSPDGAWLAFNSTRYNGNRLWLLDRRTEGLTQLDTAPNALIEAARWSWDSKYLLYPETTGTGSIWQHAASTGARRKAFDGNRGDGQFCVARGDQHLILVDGSNAIVRVELTSTSRKALGRVSPGVPSGLECSPDGNWVAFHVQDGDDRDIWLIPVAGGAPRRLVAGDDEDSHPAWSADSRIVYFLRNHQDIYAAPVTGGEAKPVTRYRSFGVTLDYPSVSADGKKILFTRVDKAGDVYLLEQPPE